MDVSQLEKEMTDLEWRYKAWREPLTDTYQRFARLVNEEGYSPEEADRRLRAMYQEQLAIYNPSQAVFPVREKLLALYLAVSAPEREQLRALIIKVRYFGTVLHNYVFQCIECMESPDDGDLLFMALVAISLEGCASDFRDFETLLSELALAARRTGIEIEPHAKAAAMLAANQRTNGGCDSVRARLAGFAEYARTAERIVEEDIDFYPW